ncbi:hypothetical protein GH714_007779 [Hevea brasiliensis]|uniref:Potassium transporter n=1 Tax=Hevea brasiliensis TaxID=3981 RepID=A0A6A6M033_HEVBR|nr:hypothetical protein GH714_007779 [Hevea brasiliensis]
MEGVETRAAVDSPATMNEVVMDSTTTVFTPPRYQCHPMESGRWGKLVLAYKTLGVVFGGLVTSPLYVYPSMPLNSPTEEDYLGIYSIMFWTLTLIGVVKYSCVALKADDHGEGGTFALYSLLCRYVNIGILSSKRVESNPSYSIPVLQEGTENKCRLGKFFERSIFSRRLLLFIAMLGTCMLIGDGILTPAISVLSAMDGIRAPFPAVKKCVVVSLVMLITTILLTLVMIIIWRTPPLLVALYFFVFFTMEGVYVSAVLTKIPEGGWIPFAISFFLAFIMFVWFYGRQRKIDYELIHKIDLGRLGILLSTPGVQRVPGLCFFYTNIQDGLTPVLGHYIKNMKSLHDVTIFTTLRYLLVPKVAAHERIVINKLGLKGVYGCVIHYGYADSLNLEGDDFVNQVTSSLREHIQHSRNSLPSHRQEVQEEISAFEEAKLAGVVHIRGKTRFYTGDNCSWFDRIMLAFYEVMHSNCRPALPALGVPPPQRIEVGMLYEA